LKAVNLLSCFPTLAGRPFRLPDDEGGAPIFVRISAS
jgi:hypothetical protein